MHAIVSESPSLRKGKGTVQQVMYWQVISSVSSFWCLQAVMFGNDA